MVSRTFIQPGFSTFTLSRRHPGVSLCEITFFRFSAADIRVLILQILSWSNWLSWCRTCKLSFIYSLTAREMATPRVAIPFGPVVDSGSDTVSSGSDLSDLA